MLQHVLIFVVKIQAKLFFFLIFQTVVLVVFLVMVNFFLLLLLENQAVSASKVARCEETIICQVTVSWEQFAKSMKLLLAFISFSSLFACSTFFNIIIYSHGMLKWGSPLNYARNMILPSLQTTPAVQNLLFSGNLGALRLRQFQM